MSSVIDFCLTKNLISDNDTNYTSLQVEWASKANCIQRKGQCCSRTTPVVQWSGPQSQTVSRGKVSVAVELYRSPGGMGLKGKLYPEERLVLQQNYTGLQVEWASKANCFQRKGQCCSRTTPVVQWSGPQRPTVSRGKVNVAEKLYLSPGGMVLTGQLYPKNHLEWASDANCIQRKNKCRNIHYQMIGLDLHFS